MSYTVLARRYRSNTFDEVIGQEHIAQTLKKAIQTGRIAHAYLFCGTRGTGKTTTARILAKALNCQSTDGPTATPCGKCAACLAIARGEEMDVIEIDAASNTGVDSIRDIIENAQYSPGHCRFKVYIIDEVHMLSKSAFNALLKTLEEPPSHVKFILATTEPEKVLPTILSRCQRYDFRNIPTREIAGHLKDICEKEKITAESDALLMVAKAGAGSMRDALSLLDRLLSIGETELTAARIEELLGLPRSELIFNLAQAIADADVQATLTQADAILRGGLTADGLLVALIDHLRNLLILRTCGGQSNLVEAPGVQLDELVKQAGLYDPVAITQDIVLLEELRRHMRQSMPSAALLDATLVRMALADQFNSIASLLGQVDETDGDSPAIQKKTPDLTVTRPAASPAPRAAAQALAVTTAAPQASPAPQKSAAPVPAPELAQTPAPSIDLDDNDDLPAVGRVWDGPTRSLSAIMAEQRKAAAAAPPPSRTAQTSAADVASSIATPSKPSEPAAAWNALLAEFNEQDPGLFGILSESRLIGIQEGMAVIALPAKQETWVKRLEQNGRKNAIGERFSQRLAGPVGIRFQLEEGSDGPRGESTTSAAAASHATSPPSPASSLSKTAPVTSRAPAQDAADVPPPAVRLTAELKAQFESDDLIRAIMTELGGHIVKIE